MSRHPGLRCGIIARPLAVEAARTSREAKGATPFRILVVEDEPVIRELVKSLLTETDCEVETAASGAEGLKLARKDSFDLVLLDVVLPTPTGSVGLDGVAVCRMLRADPGHAEVPIYMLTAKAKRADVEAATRAGASGYILKPFRGAELLDLVSQLKARRREPAPRA